MYESLSTILVGQRQQAGGTPTLGSDIAGLQQLTTTLVVAADSRLVAEEVIQRLNLRSTPEALLEDLEAQQILNSLYIQISYTDPSPHRAQLVAETAGGVLSKQISEVSPDVNAVTARVWEPAVGLALGLGLAFLLEYSDAGADREERYAEGRPTAGCSVTDP
jgi:capsular polysaccharide biosynthesis protein